MSAYLDTALTAIEKAKNIILKYFSGNINFNLKQDQSPATIADTMAEEAIIKTIKEKFPDHHFYGEETGGQVNQSDFFWIIDPIDGTKNYIRHVPLFATQLALVHNGEVVLGLSSAPVLNELLYAEKDQGALMNGKEIHVSGVRNLNEAFVSFGNVKYFSKSGKLDNLVDISNSVQQMRGFGDFWSYHLLATGKIDSMIEAKTKIWDIAALTIITKEAGGEITDFDGNPITTSTTSAVASNGLIHKQILDKLK